LRIASWSRLGSGVALAGALLFTFPAPVFFYFCVGALPFAVQASHAFRFGPSFAWIVSALLALAICGGLAWLVSLALKPRVVACVSLPLVLMLGAVPIQAYDCMDGGRFTPCSAFRLYVEMSRNGGSCGDSWPRRLRPITNG
jgi:hypothetical protein